ncbi:hypothetical protein Mgra_00008612 [Meloidogyne graminicola]|nr:hypothetical protein Mgra_00008612 [Meloidogyne graminicola]
MKYSTTIIFILSQLSFILYVSCYDFRMEVLPSNYEWEVSLKASGFKIEGVSKQSTKLNQSQLIFKVEPKGNKKKYRLFVKISSKNEINGRIRSQEWELYPKSTKKDVNFYDFTKMHRFNFGLFGKEKLYLHFELKNFPKPEHNDREYYISVIEYNNTSWRLKEEDIEGHPFHLSLERKNKKYFSKANIWRKSSLNICVQMEVKCNICGKFKKNIYLADGSKYCKRCKGEMEATCEAHPETTKHLQYEKIKTRKCIVVDNPIFQKKDNPQFIYTIDFNKKKNRSSNINKVQHVDIPLHFNPVEVPHYISEKFDGGESTTSSSGNSSSLLSKSFRRVLSFRNSPSKKEIKKLRNDNIGSFSMSSTVDQVEEVEESDNEHITFKDSNESFNESINELDNEVDSDYESEDDGENVIQSTNGRRANIPPINAIDEGKKSQNINPSPHKFGVNIPTPHPYTSHSTFSDTSDHEHSEEQPASSSNTNTNNRDINLQRDTASPVFSGYPQAPINQDALYVQAYNSGNILATEHRGGYSAPPPYSGAPQTPMPYSYYYPKVFQVMEAIKIVILI